MNDSRTTSIFTSKTPLFRGVTGAGLAAAFAFSLFSLAGCKSNPAAAPIVANSGDPADANMAQPYTGGTAGGYTGGSTGTAPTAGTSSTGRTRVLSSSQSYQPQANGESYGYDDSQASAPIIRQAPAGDPQQGAYDAGAYPQQGGYSDGGYNDAEEAGEQALAETDQPPPPLPEYDQPPAPDPNYLWTPGYWNYQPTGYYWVPGAWCAPPFYGALWTPPYWGYAGSHYLFHRGYWGPHIGFYGGVNYGFGYIGTGYFGGFWRGHDFYYNRAVTNVNVVNVRNVYTQTVVYNDRTYGPRPDSRISYNGGRGGLNVQPHPWEIAAAGEAHYPPVAAQRDLRLAAASNRSQSFAANSGRPAQAFAAHPVGTGSNIAALPREQPFNRPTAPNGGFTSPGVRPGIEAVRPGVTQPGSNGQRPGTSANQLENAQRPGFNNQRPGTPAVESIQRPGQANGQRPGTPVQPGSNNGRLGTAATQPGFNGQRTATPATQPGFSGQRPGTPATQPGFNNQRPAENGGRPSANIGRPTSQTQPQTPQQPVPPVQQRVNPPAAQPPVQQRPQFQQRAPQVQQPQFQQRPAPQVQQRPAPQVQQRSATAPAARPQAAPAPRAAPAPAAAPHEGGHGR